MDNIDLNLYKTFFIVANCNSFTKAAELLYISQPAVTQAIKKLEEQLNTELFSRTSAGIHLTKTGEIVYYYAEHLCELLEANVNLLEKINDCQSKILNVGVPTHIGTFYFLDFLKKFNDKHKDVKVNIINKKSDEMIKMLIKRELDIVIDTDMVDIVDSTIKVNKLTDLESCFVCNKKYKSIADQGLIEPNELIKYPLILPSKSTANRKMIDLFFKKKNIVLNPLIEANSSSISRGIINQGIGIGWMIKDFIKDDLASEKLYEVKVNIEQVLVSLSIAYHAKYTRQIVKEFVSIFQTN